MKEARAWRCGRLRISAGTHVQVLRASWSGHAFHAPPPPVLASHRGTPQAIRRSPISIIVTVETIFESKHESARVAIRILASHPSPPSFPVPSLHDSTILPHLPIRIKIPLLLLPNFPTISRRPHLPPHPFHANPLLPLPTPPPQNLLLTTVAALPHLFTPNLPLPARDLDASLPTSRREMERGKEDHCRVIWWGWGGSGEGKGESGGFEVETVGEEGAVDEFGVRAYVGFCCAVAAGFPAVGGGGLVGGARGGGHVVADRESFLEVAGGDLGAASATELRLGFGVPWAAGIWTRFPSCSTAVGRKGL